MSLPGKKHTIRLFTDASEKFQAGMVTQTHNGQLEKDIENQQHEPMEFTDGKFSGVKRNWMTHESMHMPWFKLRIRLVLCYGDLTSCMFSQITGTVICVRVVGIAS